MQDNSASVTERRQQQKQWDKDAERLILYADFMGFKSRVFNTEHAVLKNELLEFHNKWMGKIKPLMKDGHLQTIQFSDSILIAVNGVTEKYFNLLSKAAVCLMHVALSMRIPIKGVIAQGLFSYDEANELYFGKPLVDAFLLHEELKYYGVVVHNTAEKTIKQYQSPQNPYSNTPVYIEKGKICHYHLCWNLVNTQLSSQDITATCKMWLNEIAEHVSGAPRIYIDRTHEILSNDQKLLMKEAELERESILHAN